MLNRMGLLTVVWVVTAADAAGPYDLGFFETRPIAGLPGYRGLTVYLQSYDPGNLAAGFTGTFYGLLHQCWYLGVLPTPTLDNASFLGADADKDSHFLLSTYFAGHGDILPDPGGAPAENQTSLGGSFEIAEGSRSAFLPLVWLVWREDFGCTYSASARDAQGNYNPLEFYYLVETLAEPLPGGPYTIAPGQSVLLNASASIYQPVLLWARWDLDGDAEYDDAIGLTPSVSYDLLVNDLGLDVGAHSISLELAAANNGEEPLVGYAETELTIIPEPTMLSLLALGACLPLLRRSRRQGLALIRRRR